LIRYFPAVILLAPALLLGQEPPPAVPAKQPKPNDSVTALLQPNSVLSGVMLPSYDKNRNLTGVFRAKTVTLVTQDLLAGKDITMELFNPDRTLRGRLDLVQANYNQPKGRIQSTETVKLMIDNIRAKGTGLTFVMPDSEGFLSGPTTTLIKPLPKKTAMRSNSAPLRATAMLGASLLAQPVFAADPTPPPVTAPADATVSPQQLADGAAATRNNLRAALAASAAANQAATEFLDKEELLDQSPAAPQPARTPMVFDLTKGPEEAEINCDGGMYFNGKEGLLVFLQNVTLDDPRLTMSGADDVKVFFAKKPEEEKPKDETTKPDAAAEPEDKLGLGGLAGNLGKPERVIATGSLYFKEKPKEGQDAPIEATCKMITYNMESGELILSGSPVVKQGGSRFTGKRPEQTVTITKDKDGFYQSKVSPGGTRIILPTEQLQKAKRK
jgi:hypothetical protein